MKQIHLSWLLMAAAVITACEKERVETEPAVEKAPYVYSVKATISSDAETRTDYDASGKFSWTAGDQISVLFHNDEGNKFFTLTADAAGATATFTGTIDAGYTIGASDGTADDAKIWALYPASENHTYTEGADPSFYVQPEVDFTETGFSANIPMYDQLTAEGEFSFKNLACTYKFNVKNLDPAITKVKFQIHNQTTYALSGLWAIKGSSTKYVNYDYASPGSEKSTLTYISNVTNGQAVFYVSSRYAGKFQPVIKVYDAVHDFLLKEFTASTEKKPESMTEVQQISLSVPTELPVAIVDGIIDEWDDISAIVTNRDRIVEWKYTSDEDNVYFMYKINKTAIGFDNGYDWKSYIYVAFDTDNDSSTGANGGAALNGGYEAQASFYPWRGSVEGSPECFKGLETHGSIQKPVGTNVGNATIAGSFDDTYCYLEVSIPRNLIGSPSGDITVNHSMSWQTTGETVITLSGPAGPKPATIKAEDVEVKVGKSVNIGATTNSTAAIEYVSGDTGIATVTNDGTVTGVAVGSTTITLSVAEVADAFYAATKTINVTVSAPSEGIDIDGDLSDWDDIEGVSNGTYGLFKATSDTEYLYFYSWRTTGGRYSDIWGGNGYIYLGFNLDGDDTNGVSLNENGPYDFIGYFLPYGGTSSAPAIVATAGSWAPEEGYTLSNIKCKGYTDENGAYIEYSIPRADLPTIPDEPIAITSWGNKDLSKVTLTCTL